jgi:hypothetical protein
MTDEPPRAPTVFLSYASEDRDAARRIGAALPAYGLEVWYDESELGGGDAWDQKIRRQIRECDYFMALVSARTEARREGYFRREWRLAAERTLDMADDHLFLLPVTIDDTDATGARVPEKFQTVQWLKVPDGNPTPALEALCRRLAGGGGAPAAPRVSSQTVQPSKANQSKPLFTATPFPVHEPGQNLRFGVEVLGWTFRNGYQLFTRLPRWIRLVIIIYVVVAVISRGHSDREAEADVSVETQKKLDAVANQYKKDPSMNLSKLAGLVAQAAPCWHCHSRRHRAMRALRSWPIRLSPKPTRGCRLRGMRIWWRAMSLRPAAHWTRCLSKAVPSKPNTCFAASSTPAGPHSLLP